jgi:hypothetical protein
MMSTRSGWAAALAAAVVLVGSAGWSLWAQAPKAAPRQGAAAAKPGARPDPAPESSSNLASRRPEPTVSVQEALLRPCRIPFGRETTLAEVAVHLERILNAPVVLDRAALDRQDLSPDNTVMLELEGVRLKTGLKLLLDQVGLTFKVIPEDNLLLLTDAHESDDRYARILEELKSLHRDVHDLQDRLDETLGEGDVPEDDGGRAMRIARTRLRASPGR